MDQRLVQPLTWAQAERVPSSSHLGPWQGLTLPGGGTVPWQPRHKSEHEENQTQKAVTVRTTVSSQQKGADGKSYKWDTGPRTPEEERSAVGPLRLGGAGGGGCLASRPRALASNTPAHQSLLSSLVSEGPYSPLAVPSVLPTPLRGCPDIISGGGGSKQAVFKPAGASCSLQPTAVPQAWGKGRTFRGR